MAPQIAPDRCCASRRREQPAARRAAAGAGRSPAPAPTQPVVPARRTAHAAARRRTRSSPMRSSHSCAVRRATPFGVLRARKPNATFSSTVICENKQVVLEDEADRSSFRLRRRRRCAGSSTTNSSIAMRPLSIGASPARLRSTVVLPAPFGPSSASSSPGATSRSSRRSSAPRCSPMAADSVTPRPLPAARRATPTEPPIAQRDEHRERDRREHEGEHDRLVRIGLECEVDRERHRLRRPGKLPANVIVAPNSPSARAHDSTAPAIERRADRGHRHAAERVPARRAQRSRRVLEPRVELAQRGLDGDHEERHGDERLGDDDAGRGERQADVEPAVEVLADDAASTEREEQRDAADDRRQHHRQRAQRAHCGPARELHARQQPRQRHTEQDRQAGRPQRADDREPQRRRASSRPTGTSTRLPTAPAR